VRRTLWAILLYGLLPWSFEHGSVVSLGETAPVSAPLVATPLQEFVSDHANGRVWNSYDQSQNSGGPFVLGTPSGVYDSTQGLVHAYAEGSNGDLIEYVSDHANGHVWNAYDLSADAGGGAPVSGSPSAVYDSSQDVIEVYAEGSNGDLIEYVSDHANGHVWNAYDLSADAGGGAPVSGTPTAVYSFQDVVEVYAEGSNGDLIEYVSDHANGHVWNAYDLSADAGGGAPVSGSPSAVYDSSQGLIHVYVEGSNGDLIEYVADHANGHVWNAYDLSIDAGSGTFVAGTPSALYLADQDLIHVYVRGADNDLMEYVANHANGHVWNAYHLSSATGGPTIGTGVSVLELNGVVHVYAGGPVPMGGLTISNASQVPDAGYPAGRKVVALTFDDGPSPTYTPQVLQILESYRVPASFEIIGSQGAQYPNLLEQEAAAGFGLVNHTWDHVDLTKTSPSGWVAEVDRDDSLLESVTHRPAECLRPPYGYTNASVISQLAQRGLGELMWDIDPSDYLLPGASVIAQRVLSALHPGAIIILHDGGGDRSQTVAALPSIINGVRAAGYAFVEVCG